MAASARSRIAFPARCSTASRPPDRVEGGIRVKFGPISPVFRGAALIERDEDKLAGRILGSGRRRRRALDHAGRNSLSRRRRRGAGTARVELAVGYALKGALAQFGRPSLVRNLAGRMIAEFSRNLEDRLAGRSSEAAPASINLPRLVLAIAEREGGEMG